ncbi:MAG: hypothetical protein WBN04_17825 [Paracoccaceae bacterium]
MPLLPVTLLVAVVGFGASALLGWRGVWPVRPDFTWYGLSGLVLLGTSLALPPVAIDLYLRFPREMNLPLPEALFFYPAIAFVAEVLFHLIPLAALALLLPRGIPVGWRLMPVVLIEPLFQAAFSSGAPLQSVLVFANVTLTSAAQLCLFLRYGFAAMIGLRLIFYLAWHIVWGSLRLKLLF